ncbi:MAG TPA: GntR family transcriptional regulator [Xanthobacteraceae bacterium]|jgi:DNA-binding GntR family transcriptional regulator|nr:GntR family transcriptional regulator [Xanthobacteraceae bacterium]
MSRGLGTHATALPPKPTPLRRAAEAERTPAPSLRDLAYEAIKHRIITCAFKPGEYVNEASVAATLGFGRTPVHQAINRLMLEGMVEVIPRKGVIVRPVSLDEVIQIIEARVIVEPQGVRLAAERADENEIAALDDILARTRACMDTRNIEQMMLLDREFHLVLARAARNAVLAEILRRLHERSLRFWFISLTAPEHHASVQEEHRAIIEAIRTRDVAAAERAMCTHIESFRTNVARCL